MRHQSAWLAVLFLVLFTGSPGLSKTLNYWTQLAPDAGLSARVITSADLCPSLMIDGKPSSMTKRASPNAQFPYLVCEKRVPSSTSSLSLNGKPLAVLRSNITKIAVVGDTGCRIRGQRAQACNNKDAWPLNKIATAIAAQNPDLVIHVGDYIYRGSPCPPGADCLGSPYGDNMQTWAADWLIPAQQLLSQVPFVFVRGNHETCRRNGQGWFRHLAAGPAPVKCLAASPPWKAPLTNLNLIVFDASDGRAPESSRKHLAQYRAMADHVFNDLKLETWFLTHRPIWAHMRAFGEVIDGDDTQREAFGQTIPEAVNLVLSGHLHAFQALDIESGPTQVISGNGGTLLDPMPSDVKYNFEIAGSRVKQAINDGSFGFLMLTKTGVARWRLEALDVNSQKKFQCEILGRQMSCNN